jgi:hypothetical protein
MQSPASLIASAFFSNQLRSRAEVPLDNDLVTSPQWAQLYDEQQLEALEVCREKESSFGAKISSNNNNRTRKESVLVAQQPFVDKLEAIKREVAEFRSELAAQGFNIPGHCGETNPYSDNVSPDQHETAIRRPFEPGSATSRHSKAISDPNNIQNSVDESVNSAPISINNSPVATAVCGTWATAGEDDELQASTEATRTAALASDWGNMMHRCNAIMSASQQEIVIRGESDEQKRCTTPRDTGESAGVSNSHK